MEEIFAAELIALIALGILSSVLGNALQDDMLGSYLVGVVLILFVRSIYHVLTSAEAEPSQEPLEK